MLCYDEMKDLSAKQSVLLNNLRKTIEKSIIDTIDTVLIVSNVREPWPFHCNSLNYRVRKKKKIKVWNIKFTKPQEFPYVHAFQIFKREVLYSYSTKENFRTQHSFVRSYRKFCNNKASTL